MSQRKMWSFSAIALGALSVLGVLLASCGGSGGNNGGGALPSEPTSPTSKVVVIQIQDYAFSPKEVTINPGDTVQWVLAGSAPGHTVTANDGSFDSGAIFTAPNVMFQKTFTTGNTTINYHCKAHQTCCAMQGSVRVGASAPSPIPGY